MEVKALVNEIKPEVSFSAEFNGDGLSS